MVAFSPASVLVPMVVTLFTYFGRYQMSDRGLFSSCRPLGKMSIAANYAACPLRSNLPTRRTVPAECHASSFWIQYLVASTATCCD